MEIQLRHQPSFGVARLLLEPGEAARAEAGAMMAKDFDTVITAKMEGGLMKSLKRGVLGGESLFITTLTAGERGGWVDLAANLPGDLLTVEISAERPLLIQRGSFLAAEAGVEIDTRWGGFRNLFGGEGGFLLRASGSGTVLMSCYGALDRMTLPAGQTVVVDSGHMVAFDETVTMELRKATDGVFASAASGEGLVFHFTGPGDLMMQSRNPAQLIQYLTANLPGSRA